jgi:hypothetical protein
MECLLLIFHLDCTGWCNRVTFLLMLVGKANAVEEKTKWATRFYHLHNQYIHVTGVTVTSLSASLWQKISAATDSLCKIAINQKLLCTFEKWCKFSSRIKAKSCKKKVLSVHNSNENTRHDKAYTILSRAWQQNSTLISVQLLKQHNIWEGQMH